MTRERIEDMREVVLPFVKKRLLETNYEGLGESDAKEFERDFNEILNLAIKAVEQEPILDKIRAEIDVARFIDKDTRHCKNALASGLEVALQIIDKYRVESNIEKRKPCINCEDGCEEWAGCPCVYYKTESEGV